METSWLPQDFQYKKHPHMFGTFLENCELETVARNIIMTRKLKEWNPFTWWEYMDQCDHEVSHGELIELNNLVSMGCLTLSEEGKYCVTDKLIDGLSKFFEKAA